MMFNDLTMKAKQNPKQALENVTGNPGDTSDSLEKSAI